MKKTIILCALALLCTAAASAQKYPERSLVRKGNRDFARERYDRSIERYTRATAAAPENFEAAYDLSGALYRTERFEEAAGTLERLAADTTRTAEERAAAYYNLGNAQFRQEKYAEALESYKNSLRIDSSDQEAKYNYAYTKRLLEQQQQEQQQNQNDDQDQNQEQEQNRDQDRNQDRNGDRNEEESPADPQQPDDDRQENDRNDDSSDGEDPADPRDDGRDAPPREGGISPEEQERMLDAIQAREDRTQEKLKERAGTIVRGDKNW